MLLPGIKQLVEVKHLSSDALSIGGRCRFLVRASAAAALRKAVQIGMLHVNQVAAASVADHFRILQVPAIWHNCRWAETAAFFDGF